MSYYDRGYRPRGGYPGAYGGAGWGGPNRERYDRDRMGNRPRGGGYDDPYRRGYRSGGGPAGADEWWLGGHHPGRYDREYDRAYQEFDRMNRPRYSPVGGNYHAMGGSYMYGRPPRPLRDDMWFSDWTRWF